MNYLELPVYQHKDLILSALAESQAVVVESPTGSGKTTQLPVILQGAGYGRNGVIGVTQPRRIAALSVSGFIARQMGFAEPGGGCPVGYKMRFEDRTDQSTQIKIMTDGILLQEMKLDPWLSRYAVMVIDEAHERSLNIDFILGLLKRVLEERKEFKVIISSATINASVFSEYLGECPVVKIDAQTFPVTLVYDPPLIGAAPPEKTPPSRPGSGRPGREGGPRSGGGNLAAEALLAKIGSITERFISERRPGDMLVFLPGEKMIKDCMKALSLGPAGKYLHLIPLYGRLGREEQERVFEEAPRGKTKVVISTNIAETSVTIDGITAVLDSGLSKLNYYNPRTFTSSLVEAPVSKASANQRKGRAGRTREGSCYRLYTRRDFESRPLFTTEEIHRTDLSEVVLRMADLGITNYEEFDFISPPGREGIIAAIETLNLLDALESDRTLSRTGRMMTAFPLAPRQSRIIVEALLRYPQVIRETVIAAAFLSTQSPYILPPGEETDARRAHHGFRDPRGDFVSYLKLYHSYQAAADKERFCEKNYLDERAMAEILNVTAQLEEIVSAMEIPLLSGGSVEDYLCCIGRGLIQFVCVREGREMYRSLTADKIMIHPGSVMFREDPRYIVAGEIIRTTRTYAMSVSPLSLEILKRISPLLLEELGEKPAAGRKGADGADRKKRGGRDFTNSVKIGNEIFPIETIKNRKHVTLPWEKCAALKELFERGEISSDDSRYASFRGTIVFDMPGADRGSAGGTCTLLKGEKLSLILSLLPRLEWDPEQTRPGKEHFNSHSPESLGSLIETIPLILRPVLWKLPRTSSPGRDRGAKQRKQGEPRELGFITLFSSGGGDYWFRCSRGFHTSLNESIASIEALIDELGDDVDPAKKNTVNETYRRLADYLGSLG
ncbi:MAG: ATP-dependent RNA helicase [Treponema sp.]|jgi:HrpA-like RNA helicase|nr:ATP-dependent RNA helicase [Treponema sp.]